MPARLSLDDVRHVARLARLDIPTEQLERYREQLSAVLEHIDTLGELDLDGVEPLAHPADLINRLAEDEPGPTLDIETILGLAPATLDGYLTVPKVLDDGG